MRFCYSVQLGATRCNSVHLRYSRYWCFKSAQKVVPATKPTKVYTIVCSYRQQAPPASKRNLNEMRQKLLPHCSRVNFLSTFKAPTPKNQNLKTAESIRVVLFRKSAGKLVKNVYPMNTYHRDNYANLNIIDGPH